MRKVSLYLLYCNVVNHNVNNYFMHNFRQFYGVVHHQSAALNDITIEKLTYSVVMFQKPLHIFVKTNTTDSDNNNILKYKNNLLTIDYEGCPLFYMLHMQDSLRWPPHTADCQHVSILI